MYEPIRSARRHTILRLVAAHFALTGVVNLVFFAGNTFRPLASATGGLVTGSLLVNLGFIGALVGLVMHGFGRLRCYDIGVIPRHIPVGLAYTLGIWGAAQVIHLFAGLLTYGTVSFHPDWVNPGFLLGMVLAQVVGNALFEEIAYRSFLFPQLYLRLTGLRARSWRRLGAALFLSQGLFALSHIPNRIYMGMEPGAIALDLLLLLALGILFTLIYVRTDNLFIVVGIHALGNAPTTLFTTAPALSGDGASILIYTLVIAVLFGAPLLRARRARTRLRPAT
ncbi:MAG: CPBP family intramembrane metalloprotease [Anaerolineae bacterium]|nr:CPBP family intramembrane metalloprotease [Anaerolineae bacterium]